MAESEKAVKTTVNFSSSDMLKVLVVDLSLRYGGSTSRVLSLINKAAGGKAALAVLEASAIQKEAQRLNLPFHIIGKHRLDGNIPKNLARIIRENQYQVIDTQNIQSKFWSSLAMRQANVAFISTLNSWYANEHGKFSVKGKIYTALELATNRYLDLYITVSQNDYLSLLNSGFAKEKVELIYNAIDIDSFNVTQQRDWLIEKFSLPAHKMICTAVGRLVPVKGHEVLIRAVEIVLKHNSNVHFLIVGDGKMKHALQEQIKQANLEEHITLAGFQDRNTVMTIIKSSDIFVMPSHYEGTPIAILEAGFLGTPIIASNVGGMPELVRHNQEALLVEPNQPLALAKAIQQLMTDASLAAGLKENAQKRVYEKFNLQTQYKQTWSAYQKALALHLKKIM